MAEIQAKVFLVSGLVQGVAYRANTQREAIKLGVVGWVRNLTCGDVELLACGEPAALASLEHWLWCGPRYARVDNVVVKVVDAVSAINGDGGDAVYVSGAEFEIRF